ncbi:MAG: glycosyltransferase family 1 protein [Bdellovibrionota bacterium]
MRTRNPSIKTKLVLIGGESPLFADVRLKIKAFKSDVIFKGFVSDENLRTYYANASLVAYPSLYEGFGLPPLEAMASGTPVITSMSSSIPEVVGDAAIMISPFDSDQLAEGMRQILEDNDVRESLVEKGYVRARSFNWYRVARNVLAVYYEVFNSSIDSSKTQKLISYEEWNRLAEIESQMLLS